ncbi:MAG: hypothetical protein JXQ72_16965 [Anaerolineae bacterium]|nr:hypothetical protein [Anaerolineae bacterium]
MAKKTQKKIMKKRRKDKARVKQQQKARVGTSPRTIIRKSRDYPFGDCWISPGWDGSGPGLVTVLVTRKQPNGLIAWASYLLDIFCLGLKSTIVNANFTMTDIRQDVLPQIFSTGSPEECPPELAHQIIYQSIDYAAQFDLEPLDKDFRLSQYVLAPRGTLEEPYHLTFGKDGKPFFISGPYDNVQAILAKLNRNPGPGNYEYMAMLGDPDFDMLYDDDYELLDDDIEDGDIEDDDIADDNSKDAGDQDNVEHDDA